MSLMKFAVGGSSGTPSRTLAALDSTADGAVIFIDPPSSGGRVDWRELWRSRELIAFLTWRDIKLRYTQTLLGVAWAVLQPALLMVTFAIFFGKFAKLPSSGIRYSLFVYTALVPWQYFSYALTQSANSLISNDRLLTKVYFPRLAIPLSAVLSGLADFAISFVLLLGLMLWYGRPLRIEMLLLPLIALVTIATAFAAGLWLSALNVRYRDVRHTLTFLVQLWFFVTPVAYSSAIVPERWHFIYDLNPMAGIIDAFRWAVLGTALPRFSLISFAITLATFFLGLRFFKRMEASFADLV
jgi:lipopolysaccharide transport system permease protein